MTCYLNSNGGLVGTKWTCASLNLNCQSSILVQILLCTSWSYRWNLSTACGMLTLDQKYFIRRDPEYGAALCLWKSWGKQKTFFKRFLLALNYFDCCLLVSDLFCFTFKNCIRDRAIKLEKFPSWQVLQDIRKKLLGNWVNEESLNGRI